MHVVVSVVALLAYGGLALSTWPRTGRGELPRHLFLLYLLFMAAQQALYLWISLARTEEEARLAYLGLLAVGTTPWMAYFLFTRAVSGRSHRGASVAALLLWLPTTAVSLWKATPGIYPSFYFDGLTGLYVPELGPWTVVPASAAGLFWILAGWELARTLRTEAGLTQRRRAQLLLVGLGVVIGGQVINAEPVLRGLPVDVFANVTNAALISWAMSRYQLLGAPLAARRFLVHTIPAALLMVGWFLVLRLGTDVDTTTAILLGSLGALLSILASRAARGRPRQLLERLLVPGQHRVSQMLQRISHRSVSVIELQELADLLLEELTGSLGSTWAGLFLRDPRQPRWACAAERSTGAVDPAVEWVLSRLPELERRLGWQSAVVHMEPPPSGPDSQAVEVVPLVARGALVGVLAARFPDRTDQDSRDLALRTVANQTAVAIDNARLLEHLRRELAERERIEEDRARMQASVAHMQKMEAIGTLAAGVAHDMNNVLGAIMAVASTARTDVADGRQVERTDLDQIVDACRRGRDLSDALLGFARQRTVTRRPVSVASVVREVVSLLRRPLPKGIEIHTRILDDLPPVEADPSQLDTVLMNLCLNAAAAMGERGELRIVVDERAGMDGGDEVLVRIRVSDDGPGMDPEILRQAFDPFFTTRADDGGTGLGLSMVYGIVRSHGGRVELDSSPGGGTTATILLPALASFDPDSVPPTPTGAKDRVPTLHILLVDDEPMVRRAGQRVLARMGCAVEVATGGEEAVRMFRAAGQAIDLVVLDMMMPDMDGEATFAELRALDPAIPVLVCSGYSDQAKARRLQQQPLVDFVAKPFDIDTLARAIVGLWSRRTEQQEL